MEPRAHLLFKITASAVLFFILPGCISQKSDDKITAAAFFVDTRAIPRDTIMSSAISLKLENGIYYFSDHAYSGYIKMANEDGTTAICSVRQGMLHGKTTSFYRDGKTRDIRTYRDNKSVGQQLGFWQNGNQKFDYTYLDDKREGSSKQWYANGRPYTFLHFSNDKESGMQQAWRENGKPFMNYEAINGYRYGLQKSNLCYTLENEKFK